MTTIHDAHPSRDQLAALSEGRLTGEDVLAVESHVTTCEVCADTLGELGAGDQLLARLRSAVVEDPDKTGMISINQQAEEAILKFLEPSTRAGSLGRLGHYDVLEGLGRGAFGIVLKAFDDSLQRVVAVKVLAPEIAATSPARKRFLREARTAAQVRHQNVVQIYAVEEQPLPYLVMEYIPGETLQQRLNHCGPLEVSEVLRLGHEIARGLAAAHAQGLIHRDIKPGNILLEKGLEERVKLTDFGLARAVDDASLTQSGIIAGTPMFMAPEQARGETTDQRADLFSLGSVLYTMVSGRPPFRASGTVAVLKRVCDDTPRPIQEIIPETPQWLCDIISKLHAKRPEDRFTSAREVADLLGHCLTELQQQKVPLIPSLVQARSASECISVPPVPSLALHATPPAAGGRVNEVLPFQGATSPVKTASVPQIAESVQSVTSAGETSTDPRNVEPRRGSTSLTPPAFRSASVRNRGLVIAAAALLVLLSGLTLTEATGVTKFAETIIRIATGEGQIVIETDGAGVEVVIKDQQGTVLDRETKREITFKAGEYNIEVTVTDAGGEQRFVTDQFTLTRNGKKIVDARWELAKAKPTADSADPDRRAAEWVLSVGGAVNVGSLNANEQLWLDPTKNLPAAPFSIVQISLRNNERVTESGLMHLNGLSKLSWLDLVNSRISDAGLMQMENLPSLTTLLLEGNSQVSDAGLENLKGASQLKLLGLQGTRVTDAGLQHLKHLSNLELLYLDYTNVSDAGIVHLKRLSKLDTLLLANTQVGDAILEHLNAVRTLRALDLTGTKVKDLTHLRTLNDLQHLVLRSTTVSDAAIEELSQIKSLVYVDLKGSNPTAAGVKKLVSALPQCKIFSDHGTFEPTAPADPDRRAAAWALAIDGTIKIILKETDEEREIKAGGELPQGVFELKFVNLNDNKKVTDAGLARFKDCKNLTQLHLSATQVSDVGLAHFKDCKNLTHLGLYLTQVGDAGLAHFKDCTNLTWLHLGGTQVSDLVLAQLKDCKELAHVDLAGTQVSDMGLAQLKDCKKLAHVDLGGTKVRDAGLAHLKDYKSLTWLHLGSTQVSDMGLAHFKDCKNLRGLNLDGTQVTDAGLAHLKDCKNLTSLHLWNTQVSDAGLEHVAGLPKLVYVILKNTKVTEAGVKKFSAALPECEIERDGGVIKPMVASTDPDRRAAEYVLSIGGNISIKENSQERSIGAAGDLPRGAFELTVVDLNYNPKVTDGGLARCKDCKNLTGLHLNGTQVSDAGLANFKDCHNITYLQLAGTKLSDAGLAHFKDCKNLTYVGIDTTNVTDAGLGYFQDCKDLQVLGLSNTAVSDAGLVHFKDCKNLTNLGLGSTPVTDAGLAHFKHCENLTVLELYHTQVSDAGLAHFKDCKNLTNLNLVATQVSDAGLAHFKDCKNLTRLYLHATRVSDAGLAHFQDCRNLEALYLAGTKVSDAGLAFFKASKDLSQLDLSGTEVSDAGLAHFKDCENLNHLYLNGTWVGDAGLAHLKDCKKLMTLDLRGTQVSDSGLALFKDCKNLQGLQLSNTYVSDAGLAFFKTYKNLMQLELSGTQLSDAGLNDLESLPSLIYLNLVNTRISLRGHDQLKAALPKCAITWTDPNRSVAESVLALGGTVAIGPRDKPDSRPIQAAADLPRDYFQVRRVSLAAVAKPLDKLPEQLSSLRFAEFDRLESLDLSGITALDYGFLVPIQGLRELSLAKAGLSDRTLQAYLPKLPALKRLVLDGNDFVGPGLTSLEQQSALIELSLANAGLKDESLANLPKLPALKRLVLDGNEIRGAGLTHLKGQPELIDLSLNCPTLTDLTAKNLADLKQLKRLSLAGSGLSDTGIKHLAGLSNLESLDLRRTKATAAGVAELHEALPQCKILSDHGTFESAAAAR